MEVTRRAYERRRDILCEGLTALGWKVEKPEATMFVWAAIPAWYSSSEAFALDLVEKAGVLVTPGSAFGPSGEGHVRMALVQEEEVLIRGLDLIRDSGLFGTVR